MLITTPIQIEDEVVTKATQWRRDLHQIPELRFDLHKTHLYLLELLKKWDVEVDTGYGVTGMVVTIDGTSPGNVIALRCDMDALPMEDQSGTQWRSTHSGVAHACGHDGHMAITLAAIKHLSTHKNFSGKVKILFQPSEEDGQGAKAMMKDGMYEKHPYQELYGFHNMPRHEDKTLHVRYGATTGAGEIFTLSVMGKSGHSSVPHKCINPISVASEIVTQWNAITSGVCKDEMAVIAVCKLNSGSTINGIPDSALAGGTMRYFEAHIADYMRDEMERIACSVCEEYGATYDLLFEVLCPATVNTSEATDTVVDCAKAIFGDQNVVCDTPASPGGEDMQFFVTQGVTEVCWFMVGTQGSNLHTCGFDFDDSSIKASASMLINIVNQRLAK